VTAKARHTIASAQKGEKTTFAADPEEFEGLKNGEWAVFQGWTNKANEAIQSTGMLFR
jgi:hypothetical protein